MAKVTKLYLHFEEEDGRPSYTHIVKNPDPKADLASFLEEFETAYNAKFHPSNPISRQFLTAATEGGKSIPLTRVAVSVGEDIFLKSSDSPTEGGGGGGGGETTTTNNNDNDKKINDSNNNPSSSSAAAAAAPSPSSTHSSQKKEEKATMEPKKFYFHYEENQPNFTHVFRWNDAAGTLCDALQQFVEIYNTRHGSSQKLGAHSLAVQNEHGRTLPLDMSVKSIQNGADFFVLAADVAEKEDNAPVPPEAIPSGVSAIEASRIKAKDKSYYYWRLDAKPEEMAPKEAPPLLLVREMKQREMVFYKSIQQYSFLDDGDRVKVYLTLPGIGSVAKDKIKAEFHENAFSWMVHDYQGKHHRFQSLKMSDDIVPELSKFIIKSDSVIISMKKRNEDKHWFELHKTKGIGEG